EHCYEISFHLHPSVIAEEEGSEIALKKDGKILLKLASTEKLPFTIEEGWYSREYGHKEPTCVIRFKHHARGETHLNFELKI
ncbi:MAG: heparinase II/III family protein, partial [bacterium]